MIDPSDSTLAWGGVSRAWNRSTPLPPRFDRTRWPAPGRRVQLAGVRRRVTTADLRVELVRDLVVGLVGSPARAAPVGGDRQADAGGRSEWPGSSSQRQSSPGRRGSAAYERAGPSSTRSRQPGSAASSRTSRHTRELRDRGARRSSCGHAARMAAFGRRPARPLGGRRGRAAGAAAAAGGGGELGRLAASTSATLIGRRARSGDAAEVDAVLGGPGPGPGHRGDGRAARALRRAVGRDAGLLDRRRPPAGSAGRRSGPDVQVSVRARPRVRKAGRRSRRPSSSPST